MRVAVFQARAGEGRPLERLSARAAEAARAGAELLVCPELYTSGYNVGDRARALAEPADGPSFERASDIAREHGVALVYGYPELADGRVYNAARLVDATGAGVGSYRKTHLYGDWERAAFTHGEELGAVMLGETCVGPLICYDVEFPEACRVLARAGAELVVVPTACRSPWAELPARLIPIRAMESHAFVLYANWCGEEEGMRYAGRSCVGAPDGTVCANAGDDEELLVADLDLNVIEAARAVTPYLDDRRPDLYDC